MKKPFNRLIPPLLIGTTILIILGIWQLSAYLIDIPYILPMPASVFTAFGKLIISGTFWKSIFTSFVQIYSGCLAGILLGFIIGILTCVVPALDTMLSPVFSVLRATPVACFIVLAWAMVGNTMLPFFISFIMVAPIIMTGTQSGYRATREDLLETAKIYRFSRMKIIRACYLPAILPHLFTAILNCIGLAWKAGIAAEVIASVGGTIGFSIWESKYYLDSANLFAWTLAVIIISLVIEYIFKRTTKRLRQKEGAQ